MFEPVDEHFRAEDQEEGTEDLADPVGEGSEVAGENTGAPDWGAGVGASVARNGGGATEAVGLDDIASGNDHKHEPKLEALDDVGAGNLEEVVLFEFLEDRGFDFDKLVGHE